MYVYQRCTHEPLYTVGFYTPEGEWKTDSDWDTREEAAERVHYLNGGNYVSTLDDKLQEMLDDNE